MGAHSKSNLIRRLNRWRLRKSPLKVAFLLFLWLVAIASEARASGDLKNNGAISNTGAIRIKNQVTGTVGIPSPINGTVEFFGTNQTIPSATYNNLSLTGTGVNNTAGLVTLNGTLVEGAYLSGSIGKTVDLTSIASSNFGNIGLTLSYTGTSPGVTTVTRTSGTALSGSIKRYYDISASSSGYSGTIDFQYNRTYELNGLDESTLELWRSIDAGTTWRRQGGTVNTGTQTITKSGILSFSRWTASDATHLLGPAAFEWVAQNLASTSGSGQTGSPNTNLANPFVTTVTDGYGNPIANAPVTFAIASTPVGATGQNLSVINANTDASGHASSVLHLGSASGTYTVTASSGALTPATFTATASGGPPPPPPPPPPVPTSIAQTSGNGQIDTVGRQLAIPLKVTVLNQFGSPYAGATVNFAVTTAPVGATGQQLSTSSAVTGADGQASALLTLGTKLGTYAVTATLPSLPGITISFNATAIAGRVTTLAMVSGDTLSQAIKTTLNQPFIVRTVDAHGNPVSGVPVTFAIDSIPSGAVGQSLTNTTLVSDSNGYATTILTLGDKISVYRVSATSVALNGSPLYFRATATNSNIPATIVYSSGDNQSAQVRTQLANPLVVTVLDPNGNPVAAQVVKFRIASVPTGAVGAALSDTIAVTNLLGQASANLTMGTKVGTYMITASSDSLSGSPITFRATAAAGRTVYLLLSSGNNQSASVRTTLPLSLVVAATDTFGNAKQGVNVGFAITRVPAGANGQRLSNAGVVTGADGLAATRLTLGDSVGAYEVSATSGSLLGSPVTFTINATQSTGAASIALAAGDAQLGPVLTTLANPFVVTVKNAFGNFVAGVPVTFTILDAPSGATGQQLASVQGMTDSFGRASALLVLGSRTGVYRVAASSTGLLGSPVVFTATAEAASAASLVLVSGLDQAGTVRTRLHDLFVLTVLDAVGNPVTGTSVTFAIDSIPNGASGQSFDGAPSMTVTTDAAGLASVYLTLGNIAGVYRVIATSSGLAGSPIVFRATAVASSGAVSIVYKTGDAQSAPVLTELASPLVVSVLSATGNPVIGQTVVFAIDSLPAGATGQALLSSIATTDTAGRASAVLRLGSKLGTYRITATADDLAGSPVIFRAVATLGEARALVYLAGDGQTKQIGSTLDSAFVVQVMDAGQNPVPGVFIKFSLDSIPNGATGQRLTILNSTTDSQGKAASVLTLGNLPGDYKVSASSTVLVGSPVEFKARASGGTARTLLAISGDGQTKPISSMLDSAFVIRVLDQNGNPVPGVAVQFTLDSSPNGATGQRLTVLNSSTDVQGQAAALLTLGTKVGSYVVSASSPALPGTVVKFTGRAVAGQVAAMILTSGNEQAARVLADLPSPFVVMVLDSSGNPVSGVTVQFTLDSNPSGATGQRLTVLNSITDVQGQAAAALMLGTKVGAYVVSASSPALPGTVVKFTGRAVVGQAAAMSLTAGNEQTAYILAELLSPFVVTVFDAGGNPVSGAGVQFAIESIPSTSVGQKLRIVNSTTDVNGQASAFLTFGDKVGRYSVLATVTGTAGVSVRFAATATVLFGDVNANSMIDIADLTTVIDHIRGKISLTGNDSVKADFNRDGRINGADIVAMQNQLLTIQLSSGSLGTLDADPYLPMNRALAAGDSADEVKGEFVLNEDGVRFNMTNTAPVKGLEVIVRFKPGVSIARPDVIFDRARVDSFYYNISGTEMRIVAYNMRNVTISAGDGPLFRLPMNVTDVGSIESAQVIISKTDDAVIYDLAFARTVTVRPALQGEIPTSFTLFQNYPNPFNGGTKIEYEVADAAGRVDVKVQVFNALGEKVKTLASGVHAGGRFTVAWDGTDAAGRKLASGVYYYRLISGTFMSAKKMLMLK